MSNERFHNMHFFFNDTATTEIYTLSLHDALPISCVCVCVCECVRMFGLQKPCIPNVRSEEHTSELQSHLNLVVRILLEKNTTARCDSAAYATERSRHECDLLWPQL